MPESTPTPQFEDEIRAVLETPPARPEFVSRLQSQLLQQASVTPARRHFFLRPAWAAALILALALVAGTLIIGPQRIVSAFGSLFGYLPGIGLVQNDGSLRLLDAPVQVQREGITLAVEQGAADPTHTVLIYHVEGLSLKAANSQGETAPTGGPMVLLLPDGTFLSMTGAQMQGWGTGYQTRLVFPALPAGVNEATLLIYRLETMPAGAAPEDWRLPLKFKPAPADLKVMPVYELATASSTTTVAAGTTPPDAVTPGPVSAAATLPVPSNQSTQNGITLSLDKVIELADGYQLEGKITWDKQQYTGVMLDIYSVHGQTLTSGDGQPIPLELVNADTADNPPGGNSAPWALHTNSKSYPGPWTLAFPRLQVIQVIQPGPASFQFDFGPDPHIGQTWQLDQELEAAGQKLHLVSATLEQDSRSQNPKVNFVFETAPDVSFSGIIDPANVPEVSGQDAGAESGGSASKPGQFEAYIVYLKMPTGVHTIQIDAIFNFVTGPWQVSWNPPATGQPAPTQAPEACFTSQKWQQAQVQPAGKLPQSLSGRLLLETNTGQLMPQLSVVSPDGGTRQDIAIGGWSSLSPDGSTVAFIKSNGPSLFLADVNSGEIRPVPNSGPDDYHPVWSPDGRWLAFVRSLEGIFIIHPDGTGLKQVLDYTGGPAVVGFLPDNQRLVVTTLGAGGSQVKTVDLQTGKVADLFTIENAKGGFALLSPDGTRLAFSEMTFGLPSYGIYVAALDGSDKRLVAGLEAGGVSATAWSPDGQWLALTVDQFDGSQETETPVLLNLDSCQVYPVPSLSGRLVSWSALQP